MIEIYVSKISEYIGSIERLKRYYPNQMIIHNPISLSFLYRGLASKDYGLLPGLFRKQYDILDDENHGVENDRYLTFGNEKEILYSFMHEAISQIQLSSEDLSRWAEYAQHYGVPTRFLDWSKNPLVALYFACRDEKEKDGKVWLLHARNYDISFPERRDEIKDLSRREIVDRLIAGEKCCDYPLLYTPFYVDSRMSEQSSYFMAWGTKVKKLEEMFSDDKFRMRLPENDDGTRLYGVHQQEALLFSFLIGANEKQPLLRELDMVGINEKTLFPGLDGIGRYIERKYRFDYKEVFN
ncbi:MAG: FRG domain-containing protein [Clostridiales bacterium]|nr:FRG domain-containing protein [Clostridiales bacterium]